VRYGQSITNRSGVDYLYWDEAGEDPAFCRVDDVDTDGFRVDLDHVFSLNLTDVTCTIIVSEDAGGFKTQLAGTTIAVPRHIDLEWYNDATESVKLTSTPEDWPQQVIPIGSSRTLRDQTSEHLFHLEGVDDPSKTLDLYVDVD
jgi:hypothetical protein